MGNRHGRKAKSTGLTRARITMLKACTKFSEKEIQEHYAGFINDSPTGKLNKKKFTEICRRLYPNSKVDNWCKYIFATMDTNNDGVIDFDEFILGLSITSRGTLDQRLGFAFDMYDISNDGRIDRKELSTIVSALYDLDGITDREGDQDPKKCAEDIIAALDVDGDNKISKAEFIAGLKANPTVHLTLDSYS